MELVVRHILTCSYNDHVKVLHLACHARVTMRKRRKLNKSDWMVELTSATLALITTVLFCLLLKQAATIRVRIHDVLWS